MQLTMASLLLLDRNRLIRTQVNRESLDRVACILSHGALYLLAFPLGPIFL